MAEYPTLIPDTFRELLAERERHLQTLIRLERWKARSGLRMAGATIATDRCRLCDEPPAGVSVELFRSACPCRGNSEYIATERERLSVQITNGKKPKTWTDTPTEIVGQAQVVPNETSAE